MQLPSAILATRGDLIGRRQVDECAGEDSPTSAVDNTVVHRGGASHEKEASPVIDGFSTTEPDEKRQDGVLRFG